MSFPRGISRLEKGTVLNELDRSLLLIVNGRGWMWSVRYQTRRSRPLTPGDWSKLDERPMGHSAKIYDFIPSRVLLTVLIDTRPLTTPFWSLWAFLRTSMGHPFGPTTSLLWVDSFSWWPENTFVTEKPVNCAHCSLQYFVNRSIDSIQSGLWNKAVTVMFYT